jgi:hypothetical protein
MNSQSRDKVNILLSFFTKNVSNVVKKSYGNVNTSIHSM